jgi:hypothetical protein
MCGMYACVLVVVVANVFPRTSPHQTAVPILAYFLSSAWKRNNMHIHIYTRVYMCSHISIYIYVHVWKRHNKYVHTCMYTHVHAWKRNNKYTHTCMYTCTHISIYIHVHVHVHTWKRNNNTHTCIHTFVYACTHISIYIHVHVHVHTWKRNNKYTHACVCTHMCTYMGSYKHLHTCTHTYTRDQEKYPPTLSSIWKSCSQGFPLREHPADSYKALSLPFF